MSRASPAAAAEKIVALVAGVAGLAWGLPSSVQTVAVSLVGLIALGRAQREANKPLATRFAEALQKMSQSLQDEEIAAQIDALLSTAQPDLGSDPNRLIANVRAGRNSSEALAELVMSGIRFDGHSDKVRQTTGILVSSAAEAIAAPKTFSEFFQTAALADLLQSSIRTQSVLGQLEAGRKEVLDSLSALLHQLRSDRQLVLRLNRKPPPEAQDQLIALTFDARATEFVGRDPERRRIAEFLEADAPLLWWQIAGPGGEGKSRFALDVLDGLDPTWYGGFLSNEDLGTTNWKEIDFPEPTVIVVDYLAVPAKADAFARMVRALHDRAANAFGNLGKPLNQKIRVLALEREAYEFDPTGDSRGISNWLSTALLNPGLRGALRTRAFCASGPLLLPELGREDIGRILQSFRQSRGKSALAPPALDRLLGLLGARSGDRRRTRAWRPLFAMIAGEVARDDGTLPGEGGSIEGLLEIALVNERAQFWPNDGNLEEGAINLALVATMTGGIPTERFLDSVAPNHGGSDAAAAFYGLEQRPADTLRQAWCALGRNIAPDPEAEAVPALEARTPDLMGEGLVLYYLRGAARGGLLQAGGPQRIKTLTADAWSLAPIGFLEFMLRISYDFPRHMVIGAIADSPLPAGVLPVLASQPIGTFAALGMKNVLLQQMEARRAGGLLQPTEVTVALIMAVAEGHAECVRLLLEQGAAPDKTDEQSGLFPLLIAAAGGRAECVRLLLEKGAEPDKAHQQSGLFPLLMASELGHAECVGLLLEQGAASDKTHERDGTFPLLMAAQNGHAECVGLLLEWGAGREQRHPELGTARDVAMASGLFEIVALLDA
jgi:Ankyrin repeats (3 copies)/Ankyrin repeat